VLIGVGVRRRSTSQAIDLPGDGGAILDAYLHLTARSAGARPPPRLPTSWTQAELLDPIGESLQLGSVAGFALPDRKDFLRRPF
jgi:hypothetical protein